MTGDDYLRLAVNRPAYTYGEFEEKFYKNAANGAEPWSSKLKEKCKHQCTRPKLLCFILSLFPFIEVFRTYKFKQYILKDMVAGICVGVIHIPQSLGFALITGVPPVYGLYSSFFPILVYFIFGTSHHLSAGTMAVISIMIGAIVEQETMEFRQGTNITADGYADAEIEFRVDVASSVTLVVGFIQLIMSVLQLGVLATFMSQTFVGGFITGAGFHILTSQMPFLFGFKIPRQVGIFRFFTSWYWIFISLPKTNIAAFIISIICIVFLILIKEIVNEKFKNKIKIPIPAELIAVIFATAASYIGRFDTNYNVRIVDVIPPGIPAPRFPSIHHVSSYIIQAVAISLVSYAMSMSLSKAMSQKHDYDIRPNQELFALGALHAVSSCFRSFAGAGAPPRTLVQDSAGGQTQVASLFSALLVLLVCLVIGPLFKYLPNATLGSIISVAILPLFKQFLQLPTYWKISKADFIVWVLTFTSVLVFDVDYGLYIGIGVSLFTLVLRLGISSGHKTVEAISTSLYMQYDLLKEGQSGTPKQILIFKFNAPLCYINIDKFKLKLNKCVIAHKMMCNSTCLANGHKENALVSNSSEEKEPNSLKYIILDCSCIPFADLIGLNYLKAIFTNYKKSNIRLVFACCSVELISKLKLLDIDVSSNCYPSIQDAVLYCSRELEVQTDCKSQTSRY